VIPAALAADIDRSGKRGTRRAKRNSACLVTLPSNRIAMPGSAQEHRVNLSGELEALVLAKVETSRYQNAAEVIGAALRTLDREERECDAKLGALRTAIDEGDASRAAEVKSSNRVLQTLNIPEDRNR
jgi:putative addiction module CopG family antidote